MSLITIPAELQLLIAEQLDPKSCYKLALTCKLSSRMFASLVAQHKKFWLRYNTIIRNERLIWDITQELVEDPRGASYVEDISLPHFRQETWKPDHGLKRPRSYNPDIVPEELVQLYISAVRRHPILRRVLEEKQYLPHVQYFGGGANWNMETTIRKGDIWPIVAILCALTPNLRILRFTEPHRFGGEFFDMVYRIALAYKDPLNAQPLPFQHLTRVAVAHWDLEGSCDVRWAMLFLAMPSLRQFAARSMGGSQGAYGMSDEYGPMPRWFGQSNVINILFADSLFAPDAVNEIIASTKALESFAYGNGGGIMSDEGAFAPSQIAAMLEEYAGHSLQRLALYTDDRDGVSEENYKGYVDLSGFKKLKEFYCDFELLIPTADDIDIDDDLYDEDYPGWDKSALSKLGYSVRTGPSCFSKQLPPSLEVLTIKGWPSVNWPWTALARMLEESEVYLPNLKQIWFEEDVSSIWPYLQRILKDKGIEYKEMPYLLGDPLFDLLKGQGSLLTNE